ncbi:hypothetical protein QA596_00220 [Balneolales bacterium ANBcel1]|nr:hypothetical protein [Balneolales bacterium ANBcel1]
MTQRVRKLHRLLPVLFVAAAWMAAAAPATSQQMQTLFDGNVRHGGFGGPVVKFSSIDGKTGVWVGGRGGWILNFSNEHAISLGGGGYGLVTEHQVPNPSVPLVSEFAAIGYGGFEMEYTNRTYQLVHFTASTLIGAGGATTRDSDYVEIDSDANTFFVLEPGLNIEMNVTSFFRIATGVSYFYTSGISKAGLQDSDFSGFKGKLTFKFGSF